MEGQPAGLEAGLRAVYSVDTGAGQPEEACAEVVVVVGDLGEEAAGSQEADWTAAEQMEEVEEAPREDCVEEDYMAEDWETGLTAEEWMEAIQEEF